MISAKEVKELKDAVKNVNRPEHSLYFEGKAFKCAWREDHYEWTAPSGTVYRMTAKEVIKNIGHGGAINYFSYDFVSDGESEESA